MKFNDTDFVNGYVISKVKQQEIEIGNRQEGICLGFSIQYTFSANGEPMCFTYSQEEAETMRDKLIRKLKEQDDEK